MTKKIQRQKREVHKFKKKAGFLDKHHLRNCSRGGATVKTNLFLLDAYRHDAWHLLFGNKTINEIISLLLRVQQIKTGQRLNNEATTLLHLIENFNDKKLRIVS